jgi:glucose dehydrogenase
MVGGVLATAGQLVFTGEGNGELLALHAESGALLWHYKAPYGVNAPPVTYAVAGKQYVAVVAGGNQLFNYQTGDQILVFSLGSDSPGQSDKARETAWNPQPSD